MRFTRPQSTIVQGRGVAAAVRVLADEESRDLVERALRGRQSDALRRRLAESVETLEREREMHAALAPAIA